MEQKNNLKKQILDNLYAQFKNNHNKFVKCHSVSRSLEISESELKPILRYLQQKEMIEAIWPTGDVPLARLTAKAIDVLENENKFDSSSPTLQNIHATNVQINYGDTSINTIQHGDDDTFSHSKNMSYILFLAANPNETEQLQLAKEVNKIDNVIQKAKYRDQFELKQRHAVNITELQELLLRFEPSIVHFSGHGSQKSSIILEQENGSSVEVPPKALTNLFRIVNSNKKNIQCVLLNACYSEKQAEAIAEYIPCVIGMSTAISDEAAIKFATSFYRALANGLSVKSAFELGLNDLDLQSIPEAGTPKLKFALGMDPAKVMLVKG